MAEESLPQEPTYYIRDARSFVGDCVVWWRAEGQGYTCDLAQAGKFSREEATTISRGRATDVAYQCDDVDRVARQHVTQGALSTVSKMDPRP